MRKVLPPILSLILLLPSARAAEGHVPAWAKESVWYQIFPERFRDGDATNNPTRSSLEWPIIPSERWKISKWTGDWYARDDWEKELDRTGNQDPSPAFYKGGVFNRRYGGDLQGVIDKLDYLADLGINAIYFNPVFYARSMHKYDGNSFHHVDPYLGPDPKGDFAMMDKETADPATWQWTAADKLFLELIKKARERKIRVVIDGVFNHTGRDFFAFQDLRKNQEKSAYRDWYQVDAFDQPGTTRNEFAYRGWWGHKTLPVFSATPDGKDMAPGPKAYVFDATKRWMDPNGDGDPSDGIDGWRLDVADERPAKFWADWNALVLSINPQAYTTAEVWSSPLELIQHGNFSASMNYYGFAYPVKGFLVDRNVPPSKFSQLLDERRKALPVETAYAMQNLMDSHDTDRLASMIVNGEGSIYPDPNQIDFNNNNNARISKTYKIRKPDERERAIQRLVVLFQMTYVGAPMVYYGTEAGMWGGNDPDVRMPMIWADLKFDPQAIDPRGDQRKPDEVKFDASLFAFYKSAIALRRATPALSLGDYAALGAFDDKNTFVFLRSLEREAVVVALNRSDAPQTVEVELSSAQAELLAGMQEIFSTKPGSSGISCALDGNRMRVTLPPLTGAVFGKPDAPPSPAKSTSPAP
ncbi:MAG: glycoside hydrolase family 13 protein [Terrimicrobiaceae bacterium]